MVLTVTIIFMRLRVDRYRASPAGLKRAMLDMQSRRLQLISTTRAYPGLKMTMTFRYFAFFSVCSRKMLSGMVAQPKTNEFLRNSSWSSPSLPIDERCVRCVFSRQFGTCVCLPVIFRIFWGVCQSFRTLHFVQCMLPSYPIVGFPIAAVVIRFTRTPHPAAGTNGTILL